MKSAAGSLPDLQPCGPRNSFASMNRTMPINCFARWTGRPQPWVVVFGHRDALCNARYILVSHVLRRFRSRLYLILASASARARTLFEGVQKKLT